MTTIANVKTSESGHWYFPNGKSAYTVIAKGSGLPRSTTLRDARQLGLLPSVTQVLRVLHKEALVNWRCEQTALAVLTTPKLPGESLDAFVERVLHTDRVQDEEAKAARDKGTAMHAEAEAFFSGGTVSPELVPWIMPALEAIRAKGTGGKTETVLVGSGYAGKADFIQDCAGGWIIWDIKSSKKLPDPNKGAWSEHRLQLSAYAEAFSKQPRQGAVSVANCYISTVNQGEYVIIPHLEWRDTFREGFAPLLKYWTWMTGYNPVQRPATV